MEARALTCQDTVLVTQQTEADPLRRQGRERPPREKASCVQGSVRGALSPPPGC